MLPWLPFPVAGALLYPFFLFAFVIPGEVGFWPANAGAVLMFGLLLLIDKKTDGINATWGEGARGEFRVGEELEKLHKDGFHVFHDWNSGRGNVDHFVVGPQGVFAIETKAWTGEISCENGALLRDGKTLPGKDPLKQAKGEAADVSRLISESRGVSLWVDPVLCFSKAELRCYGDVEGVILTDVGALRRTVLERPECLSSRRVNSISYSLERHLRVAAAAKPNSPPRGPGRLRRALRLDRVFVVVYGTFVFGLTVAFPGSTVTLLEKAAGFYRFVDQTWSVFP